MYLLHPPNIISNSTKYNLSNCHEQTPIRSTPDGSEIQTRGGGGEIYRGIKEIACGISRG